MSKSRIGLLPLYISLYDEVLPEERPAMEHFYAQIAEEFANRNLTVVTSPLCRVKEEFAAALHRFTSEQVDAIVTLHLAYSPSLESADLLAKSSLPIVVLNTTPSFGFGPGQEPRQLMYNHGIHGVQDLCNVLRRKGKQVTIEAGHWKHSDVLDRVVEAVRANGLAERFRGTRVGRVGEIFTSMGDLLVSEEILKTAMGFQTVECDPKRLREHLAAVDEESVVREMESDRSLFVTDGVDQEAHRYTTRTCLALRKWMEEEKLTAVTFNFLHVTSALGLPTVPFLEASKAMARGIGYAGEGDVLTAALVGALASTYPDTTFTEMFCPDWEGNTVFLSHMGEMNYRLCAGKPKLTRRDYAFSDVCEPLVAVGCFRSGHAVLVDLAPQLADRFSLILSPVEMVAPAGRDEFADSVHGWFRPSSDIADFLADYSRHGGTHHLALVYGNVLRPLKEWGARMGWDTVVLE